MKTSLTCWHVRNGGRATTGHLPGDNQLTITTLKTYKPGMGEGHLQAVQDVKRLSLSRLADEHRLEAALERGVLLDVPAYQCVRQNLSSDNSCRE